MFNVPTTTRELREFQLIFLPAELAVAIGDASEIGFSKIRVLARENQGPCCL
jgi:hypothetical protein